MDSWSRAYTGQRIGLRALRPQHRQGNSAPPLGTCVPALRARRPPQARCRPQGLQGFVAAFTPVSNLSHTGHCCEIEIRRR